MKTVENVSKLTYGYLPDLPNILNVCQLTQGLLATQSGLTLRINHTFNSPLMFTAGNTMDIFGLVVLLCVVAGSSR